MKLTFAAGAVLALLAVPTTASAGTTLATGVLRDAAGQPRAGTVTAYGWPYGQTDFRAPVVGSGTAGPDGRYVVRSIDDATLRQLAAPRQGSLDVVLRADDGSSLGESVTTVYAPDGQTARAHATAAGDDAVRADVTTRYRSRAPAPARTPRRSCRACPPRTTSSPSRSSRP